ncbi:MAG: YncE family protein, partial [Gemmatimonadales bacterium]
MTSQFKRIRIAVALAAATAGLAVTAYPQAPTIAKSTKVAAGIYEIVAYDGLVYTASVGSRGAPKPEITVLDGKTLEVKQTYPLTAAPYGLGINTKTGTLYATDTRGGSVIVVDAKSGRQLGLIKNPADTAPAHLREVVVDEVNNRIYVS